MARRAYLVLEDGCVFAGRSFGAEAPLHGEVVFNTSMTGYQEMLTDPSYAGQILVLTYPLVGNYGINRADVESRQIQVRALVVREACELPSHWESTMTLDAYLRAAGIPGLAEVDTRALTRRLRSRGVMMGTLAYEETPQAALARLGALPAYGGLDYVRQVSTPQPYPWEEPQAEEKGPLVVVLDFGLKRNILRSLRRLGCRVLALPCTATAQEVLALGPQGVVLSPGPGDPALLDYAVATVTCLVGQVPLMGICLGHQLLGRAFGAQTYKLKFGHRGANHPVRDLTTRRVYITSQNHGYAVDPDGLREGAEPSHLHLNDGTVEGLRHRELPILSIQYHSEAAPGPLDNMYLFERFLAMVKEGVP